MAVLNEEQTMIRDGAKSWVQEKSPITAFRKLRDSSNADGLDRNAWKEMAEMGWAGILIPEEFGGTGLGYLTLGLVLGCQPSPSRPFPSMHCGRSRRHC